MRALCRSRCAGRDAVRRPGAQGRARLAGRRAPTAWCRSRCATLRDEVGDGLVLMADDCLDEYTDHGHCGLLTADGEVDNDATLERYASIAIAQAGAGADVIAPSRDDGRPGRRDPRRARRDRARDDRRSSPTRRSTRRRSTGRSATRPSARRSSATGAATRWTPANAREALVEVALDVDEGADMVMVKPALAYLDVIAEIRGRVRRARRRVPRERRVRDGEGGRAARLDRRRPPSRSSTCSRSSGRAPTSSSRTSRARSPSSCNALLMSSLVRAGAGPHPGRGQLAGARVRLGGRRAVLRRARARRRTSSTPTAASTSTTCSRGARRSSATRTRRSSRRCSAPRPTARRSARPTPRRGRARRGDLRARAVGREGAARVVGHRSGDDRGAARARRDRAGRRS